jgi:transposase
MRQVREILRLKFGSGTSGREIALRLGIAASTVRETLKRFAAAGLTWPLAAEVTEEALEERLYGKAGTKQGHRRHTEPDWAGIHRELKRKHVTLSILWDEYIERHPDGYRYSRFCELYRHWEGRLSVTMRQNHAGGDKLFVDYAGDGVPVVDRLTGEVRQAQIFVAVMGASNFTYAEATWTQGLADWIGAHAHAFAAIGGVPHLLVPDNTKVAVIKACLYDPQINRTYAAMAAHYGAGVLSPLDAGARHDLLEILEARYSRHSTIITSQVPVDKWHDLIGDPTYADAILDRLVHNAHRIELAGDSLRKKRKTDPVAKAPASNRSADARGRS